MWYWLKVQVARAMTAIGVDWHGMSDGDKLNSAISLFLGAIGVLLGLIGLYLAKGQKDLADKQDKLANELLGRKSQLSIALKPEPNADGSIDVVVMVENKGDKSAPDFYWWIYVPMDRADDFIVRPVSEALPESYVADDPRTGRQMTAAFGYFYPKPLYSGGMTVHIATLHVTDPRPFRLRWKFVSEDGGFPPGNAVGETTIPP